MSIRIETDVRRGRALTIEVDGVPVPAWEGETIAAALIAAGITALRTGSGGAPHGLYCNMGTCGECTVSLRRRGTAPRRARACLVPAEDGMAVTRGGDPHG